MPYQEMYFYLDSDYKHGRGYSSPEAGEAFQSEISRLFAEAGWEIRAGRSSGVCDSAVKGKQDLYLHPMMVSGVMLQDEVGAVEQILQNGTTFRLREIRGVDEYQDMEDDDYRVYLESKHDEIETAILDRYRTKRRNLYVTGYTTSSIAKLFEIKRVQSAHKSGDMAEGYVGQLIQELIESGKLVTAETRHGTGIRTATASELAQPIPGQQAMGGMSGLC